MRDDERISEMVWSYHMRGMTTSQVSIAMEMAGEHVDPGRVHDIVVARWAEDAAENSKSGGE